MKPHSHLLGVLAQVVIDCRIDIPVGPLAGMTGLDFTRARRTACDGVCADYQTFHQGSERSGLSSNGAAKVVSPPNRRVISSS